MFFIVLGIIELVISIVTFNLFIFLFSIVTTFLAVMLIGGKLKSIDEESKKETE